MTKFSEKFFCPLPWTHMYYQTNSPSPCHLIKNTDFNITPKEYLNSDWLKKIKKDMVSGVAPEACRTCSSKEKLGLKSTRGAAWGYYGVGDEPHYEDRWFYNKFDENSKNEFKRIEIRFSNLCNMKCRMCNELSSSEWLKEKIEHKLPYIKSSQKEGYENESVLKMNDASVEQLKQIALESPNLKHICFTGGEPFIIKEYYEYMDFLIENNLNEDMLLEIFTNCSVYNPHIIDRLRRFKDVVFVMSIDGVGKIAEYIRHGQQWNKVEKNILQFNRLAKPFNIYFNTAISSYVLLDVSSLAKFLMQLYSENNSIQTKCYYTFEPRFVNFENLPAHLRPKAIDEIEKAIEILSAPNFKILTTELNTIKKYLSENQPVNPQLFIDKTKQLDAIRGENFEEVFGIKL
jgi:organic radical activating enzyme